MLSTPAVPLIESEVATIPISHFENPEHEPVMASITSSARLSEERTEQIQQEIEELKEQYVDAVGDDDKIKSLEEDPEAFLESKSKLLRKIAGLLVDLEEDQAKAKAESEKAPNDVQELYKIRYEKARALKLQAERSVKDRARACEDALGKGAFQAKKAAILADPSASTSDESKLVNAYAEAVMALRKCAADLQRHKRAYDHRDMSVVDVYLKVDDVAAKVVEMVGEKLAKIEERQVLMEAFLRGDTRFLPQLLKAGYSMRSLKAQNFTAAELKAAR